MIGCSAAPLLRCSAAPLLAISSVLLVSFAPTAAPLVDDDPPTPIECGTTTQEFSDTVTVVGGGSSQTQAYLDLLNGGMDDELMAAANVKCDACTPEKDCEASVDVSGSLSGVHYLWVPDLGWLCIAVFTGTYKVHCDDC